VCACVLVLRSSSRHGTTCHYNITQQIFVLSILGVCRLVCVFLIYVRVFSYCTAVRNKAQRVVMILLNRCLSRALCVFVCACVCVSLLCVCTCVVHQMRQYDITQQIFFRSICGVHVFVCVRLFFVCVCARWCVRVRARVLCVCVCARTALRLATGHDHYELTQQMFVLSIVGVRVCLCACLFCVLIFCACVLVLRSGSRHKTTHMCCLATCVSAHVHICEHVQRLATLQNASLQDYST